VTRMAGEHFALSIAGAEKKGAHDGPRYSAIYEIDGPHVLTSPQWAKAVEEGRWPGQGRPFTHNPRHAPSQLRCYADIAAIIVIALRPARSCSTSRRSAPESPRRHSNGFRQPSAC